MKDFLDLRIREMGNIMLPKIETIDPNVRAHMLERIDNIIRNDEDIEAALDIVDRELLVNILEIDPQWCVQCRTIWKKMQNRRLSRGSN